MGTEEVRSPAQTAFGLVSCRTVRRRARGSGDAAVCVTEFETMSRIRAHKPRNGRAARVTGAPIGAPSRTMPRLVGTAALRRRLRHLRAPGGPELDADQLGVLLQLRRRGGAGVGEAQLTHG